jgi:hypothetical protein
MELITERSQIKSVAQRWDAVYGPDFRPTVSGSSKEISVTLHALNLNKVSTNTVAKVIGNDTWTVLICRECAVEVKKVVVFYGSDGDRAYQICESCATKVKTMFKTGAAK